MGDGREWERVENVIEGKIAGRRGWERGKNGREKRMRRRREWVRKNGREAERGEGKAESEVL